MPKKGTVNKTDELAQALKGSNPAETMANAMAVDIELMKRFIVKTHQGNLLQTILDGQRLSGPGCRALAEVQDDLHRNVKQQGELLSAMAKLGLVPATEVPAREAKLEETDKGIEGIYGKNRQACILKFGT